MSANPNLSVQDYIAKAPKSARGVLQKAFSGAPGYASAVKAKCLTCSNFERAEVRFCTVVLCPLHGCRPYQTDDTEDDADD